MRDVTAGRDTHRPPLYLHSSPCTPDVPQDKHHFNFRNMPQWTYVTAGAVATAYLVARQYPSYWTWTLLVVPFVWALYAAFLVLIYPFYFSPFRDLPEPEVRIRRICDNTMLTLVVWRDTAMGSRRSHAEQTQRCSIQALDRLSSQRWNDEDSRPVQSRAPLPHFA